MSDPVRVAGVARCVEHDEPECRMVGLLVHPRCAVAALQEAGALMPDEGGTCGGCGERITDPAEVRAGMHIVEGEPSYSISYVLDADENLVPTQVPDDPRQPCGPVYPHSEVTKYEVGRLTALLQEVREVLGRLLDVPYGSYTTYMKDPLTVGSLPHAKACDRLNEYKAAQDRATALLSKIDEALA